MQNSAKVKTNLEIKTEIESLDGWNSSNNWLEFQTVIETEA